VDCRTVVSCGAETAAMLDDEIAVRPMLMGSAEGTTQSLHMWKNQYQQNSSQPKRRTVSQCIARQPWPKRWLSIHSSEHSTNNHRNHNYSTEYISAHSTLPHGTALHRVDIYSSHLDYPYLVDVSG
jgi:hypothetical protein